MPYTHEGETPVGTSTYFPKAFKNTLKRPWCVGERLSLGKVSAFGSWVAEVPGMKEAGKATLHLQ